MLFVLCLNVSSVRAAPSPVRIAFIGTVTEEQFESKVKPFFKEVAQCQNCELNNLTPMNDKKEVLADQVWQKIIDLGEEYPIVYLHFNEPINEKNKKYIDDINKKLNGHFILIGTAGQPKDREPTVSLNKTVLGQIPQALILGELTERERLLPKQFYGPEMLTALKPPREYLEQGLSPLIFVGSLGKNLSLHKIEDWPEYLKHKRTKGKKLWPELEDFIPRR